MGLGEDKSIAQLEVSQSDAGLSFSFKSKRGRPPSGRQAALIMPMDRLVDELGLACPNYIKIDVPGLTDAFVACGLQLFRNPDVRELHIECGLESKGGRRIVEMLHSLGFAPVGNTAQAAAAPSPSRALRLLSRVAPRAAPDGAAGVSATVRRRSRPVRRSC